MHRWRRPRRRPPRGVVRLCSVTFLLPCRFGNHRLYGQRESPVRPVAGDRSPSQSGLVMFTVGTKCRGCNRRGRTGQPPRSGATSRTPRATPLRGPRPGCCRSRTRGLAIAGHQPLSHSFQAATLTESRCSVGRRDERRPSLEASVLDPADRAPAADEHQGRGMGLTRGLVRQAGGRQRVVDARLQIVRAGASRASVRGPQSSASERGSARDPAAPAPCPDLERAEVAGCRLVREFLHALQFPGGGQHLHARWDRLAAQLAVHTATRPGHAGCGACGGPRRGAGRSVRTAACHGHKPHRRRDAECHRA